MEYSIREIGFCSDHPCGCNLFLCSRADGHCINCGWDLGENDPEVFIAMRVIPITKKQFDDLVRLLF